MSDSRCCDRAASFMTRWNCELAWINGSPDSDPSSVSAMRSSWASSSGENRVAAHSAALPLSAARIAKLSTVASGDTPTTVTLCAAR
jgi:hypothetical protein